MTRYESSEENFHFVLTTKVSIEFAKEHLNKSDAFWKQVLWTDEVRIDLILAAMSTSPTVMHGGGLIMLWVCVAASGTGNISLIEGRGDSIKYQQILESNITPSVEKLKMKRG